MAYVGTPIDTTNTFTSLQGKRFSGDASETAFTLDAAPASTLDIEVFVGNVRQDPNSAYTVSGTTLTFSAAPPTGTNNIYVVHQAKSVGTINPPANSVGVTQLNLSDGSSGQFIKTDGSGTLSFASVSTALDDIATGDAASTLATSAGNITIDAQGGDTDIIFKGTDGSSDITALTIDMSDGGVLQTRAGVGFPATQVTNAGANVLDDYEEGTFTPTWASDVSVSVASGNYGQYTKIGNLVTVHFGAVLSASSPAYYQITNAPFQSNIPSGNAVGSGREYGHTGHLHHTTIADNSTTITMRKYDATAVNNAYLHGSITYPTD